MAISDPVRSRAATLLKRHDNDDYKAQHVGYLDHEAIAEGEFDAVPPALDARIERDRYSLIAMMLTGIYFGLVLGHFLFSLTTIREILWWLVPVVLVSVYAIVTANSFLDRICELSKAKALVQVINEQSEHPAGS
jgi:hypothetical protein